MSSNHTIPVMMKYMCVLVFMIILSNLAVSLTSRCVSFFLFVIFDIDSVHLL